MLSRRITAIIFPLTLFGAGVLVGPIIHDAVRGDTPPDARLSAASTLTPVPNLDLTDPASLENPPSAPLSEPARSIVASARKQVDDATRYDPSYVMIAYPGGDVPGNVGACTDVVIRALRGSSIDLQKVIHDDMKAHFSIYPDNWGLTRTDSNIDHRRVPNQIKYLERHAVGVTTDLQYEDSSTWQGGDIVYWRIRGTTLHCGIVTDKVGKSGYPMVIHNLNVCIEEDCLDRWEIIAHFRYPPLDLPDE